MLIYKTTNYAEMCRKAANIISAQILLKPNSVLGLATGSTPLGIYKQLTEWHQKGDLDFSQISSVNLDEYKGLESSNKQSYAYYMNQNFFDKINIPKENTHIPNGMEDNSVKACIEYNRIINMLGGIDLQLLGLGHNGHIGFNEPNDFFEKETHCVTLSQSTIDANKRFFNENEKVPTQAYTMGIKNIMQAKKIILAVSGEDKAEILEKVLYGNIIPQIPASVLQLHNDVVVVADKDALSVVEKMHGGEFL